MIDHYSILYLNSKQRNKQLKYVLNYKYENTTTFVHENIMSINFVSTYLTSIPLVGDQMYQ